MTLAPKSGPTTVCVLELFGPSSGGKSSLARKLAEVDGGPGLSPLQDRLLQRVGLGWLAGHWPRTLAIDVLAALGMLVTWRAGHGFYRFAAAQALRGGGQARLLLRVNLLRNTWKAAALRLLAPHIAVPGETLLLDEGPLQTAHYLFVHAEDPPSAGALEAFLRVVPLPDAAVYVRREPAELARRTMLRRHARVPSGSQASTERFVGHALAVFDRIAAEPRVRERLRSADALLAPSPGAGA